MPSVRIFQKCTISMQGSSGDLVITGRVHIPSLGGHMKSLKGTTKALAALIALGAFIPGSAARADILPSVGTPIITAVAGGFNWTYDIVLSSTQELLNGDSFTIYDFGAGTLVSAPSNWTLTNDPFAPLNGASSNGTATPNQTNALNWTFTWNDGPVIGQQDLGEFIIFSTSGSPTSAAFMGLGTDQFTLLKNANVTNTLVPTAAPEPASLVLLGTGMLGVAGFVRRRRRSA